MHAILAGTTLLLGCLANAQAPQAPPQPIDFAKVDRTPPKLPDAKATRQYGIYLFGRNGEHRVWAVLEGATKEHGPMALYFDRDGDGDLTEPGEKFEPRQPDKAGLHGGERQAPANVVFALGDYRPPGGDAVHKDFTITWTAKTGVRFRMLWRGSKVSFGGYGPSHDTYAPFTDKPQEAPVFVPGWDRPFAFERWIAEPLQRGGEDDFKVFVGNRGDRTGAFSAVDDEFLPKGEYAVATLHYTGADGEPATARFELKERC